MSQAICITGMHRSGTSLTASWLERCGLPMHAGDVHGPAVGNPLGHFEDKDFVDLHSAAIREAEPGSSGWKYCGREEIPLPAALRSRAGELAASRDERFGVWGWKDPRTVLFLHQWKQLIPALKTLLVWRPCEAVVRSLLRRSDQAEAAVFKINAAEAVELWRSCNRKVCAFKQHHPNDTLLVPLEAMLHNDRQVLSAINGTFGVSLDYQPLSRVLDQRLLSAGNSTPERGTAGAAGENRALEDRLMALSDLAP